MSWDSAYGDWVVPGFGGGCSGLGSVGTSCAAVVIVRDFSGNLEDVQQELPCFPETNRLKNQTSLQQNQRRKGGDF